MKTAQSAQLGQQLQMTPQLLQSIRLLHLDGMQLELEVRRMLESNPLLELDEQVAADSEDGAPAPGESAVLEVAAFDELPESAAWELHGGGWNEGDSDRLDRIEACASTDPQVCALASLSLHMGDSDLRMAAFWLEHCDDVGYLVQPAAALALIAAAQLQTTPEHAEAIRQRVLNGETPGLASSDLQECLLVQLQALPGTVPGRPVARRILQSCLPLLADHDHAAMAGVLQLDEAQVLEGVRLILSLQPRPGECLVQAPTAYVVPDVVAWHADCSWRVALNPGATPRVSVSPVHERALDNGDQSPGAVKLRELLQEARWLTRGLSMRYDTLLRTARAIVERQAGFLVHGDEAMAPLTLREIADEIGMHESTVSRITSGKYMQTPRGTFELKHFFAVRLEGANVSGPAIRAIVRRLIASEHALKPLADEAIAALLARQGIHIARRTVAKYREQLAISPARERRRDKLPALKRTA